MADLNEPKKETERIGLSAPAGAKPPTGSLRPPAPPSPRRAPAFQGGSRRGATAAGSAHDTPVRTSCVWSGTSSEWPAAPDWRESVSSLHLRWVRYRRRRPPQRYHPARLDRRNRAYCRSTAPLAKSRPASSRPAARDSSRCGFAKESGGEAWQRAPGACRWHRSSAPRRRQLRTRRPKA